MRNAIVVTVITALCIIATSCSGSDSSSQPTTSDGPATTRQPLTVSIPGEGRVGLCNWFAGRVEINSDVTCEEVTTTARAVVQDFPAQADANQAALELLIARVCTGAGADIQMTYPAADLHIPALADALVGPFCPGDRANIVALP